ncbi:hypothetical protein [Glaciecola sp. 1036]|uniref:hypothetical protein n=1 Tax=Alteromonadaceae TaxID=72275 RepID=UPI003CFCFF06
MDLKTSKILNFVSLKNLVSSIANKTKYHILILSIILLLQGCASTGLNEDLGTTIEGSGNKIVFTWSDDHPFAQLYKKRKIYLVAEYMEENQNGKIRPVRQVIPTPPQEFIDLNTKVFQLPNQLRSIPHNQKICLHLSMDNKPIPVRSNSGNGETSRFSFPAWQQLVFNTTKDTYEEKTISLAKYQYEQAKAAEQSALNAEFGDLKNLNTILKAENTVLKTAINTREDCNAIEIVADKPKLTGDVMPEELIPIAATAICTQSSTFFLDYYDSRKEYFDGYRNNRNAVLKDPDNFKLIQVLPAMLLNLKNKEIINHPIFSDVQDELNQYLMHFNIYVKYFDTEGVYKPRKDYLSTSKYALEAGQFDIFAALIDGKTPTNVSRENVTEVVMHELMELNNCIADTTVHFRTKKQSYDLNLINAPQRAIASSKYFVKACKAAFDNREETAKKFTEQRINAEKKLRDIEAKIALRESSSPMSSSKQKLNQQLCSINSN